MKQEVFYKENYSKMEAMHDSIIKEIKLEKNVLIISYENLNEFAKIYEYDNLIIKYYYESFCDVRVFSKGKYKDLEICKFLIQYKNFIFESFKLLVDNFYEIMLEISARKIKNDKVKKWLDINITLDPTKVVYEWYN